MFSGMNKQPKMIMPLKQHKFMTIICARNEKFVIESLIKSLQEQNYPSELIDIYVIADNCTDNTAELARAMGAYVYERENKTHIGKGYALEWFVDQMLEKHPNTYDALCVFDADNIVDAEFIPEMNQKLCCGENIVQGYRDIKNPTDNWITLSYAFHYWTNNLLYHLPRYNIGLSPLINGTGFMVGIDVIKDWGGWHTKTLTEDIEFSLLNIAKGRKVYWAKNAKVYDEQPLAYKQSYKQRMRWSVGHIQCLRLCFPKLFLGFLKHKKLFIFDAMLYIIMPLVLYVSILLLLLYVIGTIAGWGLGDLVGAFFIYFAIFALLIPTGQVLSTMLFGRHLPFKKWVKGLLYYPVFLLSWVFINLACLFKQKNTTWERVEHTRNINLKD